MRLTFVFPSPAIVLLARKNRRLTVAGRGAPDQLCGIFIVAYTIFSNVERKHFTWLLGVEGMQIEGDGWMACFEMQQQRTPQLMELSTHYGLYIP